MQTKNDQPLLRSAYNKSSKNRTIRALLNEIINDTTSTNPNDTTSTNPNFNDFFSQQCKLVINNSVLPTFTFFIGKQLIKNYRPISLLPICGKILEKIIDNNLYAYLHRNNLVTKNQSGFHPRFYNQPTIISS